MSFYPHYFFLGFLSLLIFFIGCTHAPQTPHSLSLDGLDRPPGSWIEQAPFYEEASKFDRLLHGTLSEREAENLQIDCNSPSSPSNNPFCSSIKEINKIIEIRKSKLETRTRFLPPISPIPLIPEWKKDKLINGKTLKTGSVQALLKGLLSIDSIDSKKMKNLIQYSLNQRSCPNNIAIAIAATLEDLLPNQAKIPLIAQLYLKGARCARRDPVDREHFQTRAALLYLFAKQVRKAENLLSKVRPTDAFSGRSLYWLYRSRIALGNIRGSKSALQRLITLHPFSFHALLALRSLGKDPALSFLEKREPFKNRSEKDLRLNQFLYQIELLLSHGFDSSRAILVSWVLRQGKIEPGIKLYLASLGDPKTRILIGSEFLYSRSPFLHRTTLEMIYPKPFLTFFESSSSTLISPFLGLSVARKESLFDTHAVSIANAQGLLQLNPETALRLSQGRATDLFDPPHNIDLGMRYLNELINRYSGNLTEVLAAYNAGEDPVAIWKQRFPGTDPVLWVDLIPYRETRDYVGAVLANYFWYRRLYASGSEIPEVL